MNDVIKKIFIDSRGSLTKFASSNKFIIKQIVYIKSKKKFTFRGLHWQIKPFLEKKIVFCLKGKAIDISINLNKKSKHFGIIQKKIISPNSKSGIMIKENWAHGILTLENNTKIVYFSNQLYKQNYSRGIRYNDSKFELNIKKPKVISERDGNWSDF